MNNLYLDALHQHRAGNLEAAEKLYHSCLEDDSENHDVFHLLSILLAQKHDFLNARYFAERALATNSNSATLHNSMGNILHNLNQHEAAINHYKTSLEIDSNNASAHNNLGNVYYHLEKFEDARTQYYKATVSRPHYVDACYNLGLVFIKQDLKSDAKKQLELVLNLQPDHGKAHSNLGYLLQAEGDFDLAMDHYQKSLECNAESLLSNHNLGVILTNKGQYDKAVQYFKKVLDLHPENIEAMHNLGAVFLLQRKSLEALPYFLCLSRITNDFDTYYNLGAIYLDLMLFDEAIVHFNKALNISPNDFATNVNLGALYLQRRDFAMAEKYYLQASYLHPDNEEIRHILMAVQQKNTGSKSPATYIKNLFDQYSSSFEEHAEALGYKAPAFLFDALHPEHIGADASSLMILDLGCGTGLSGVKFKPLAKELIGIDLSEKMLELAAKKNIYTTLRPGSIEDNITEFSDLDLIIAADSLVYFGDLADLFAKCYAALKEGGIFAFTVELSDNIYPYLLQRSVRFAHSERYIKELALQNYFAVLHANKVVLRKQDQGSIVGVVFLLKK